MEQPSDWNLRSGRVLGLNSTGDGITRLALDLRNDSFEVSVISVDGNATSDNDGSYPNPFGMKFISMIWFMTKSIWSVGGLSMS